MSRLTKFRMYHTLAYLPMVLCAPAIGYFECSVLWVIPAALCFGVGILMREKTLQAPEATDV